MECVKGIGAAHGGFKKRTGLTLASAFAAAALALAAAPPAGANDCPTRGISLTTTPIVCLLTPGSGAAPFVLPTEIVVETRGENSPNTSTRLGNVQMQLNGPAFAGGGPPWIPLVPGADGLWHGTLPPTAGATGSLPGDGSQRLTIYAYVCPNLGEKGRCSSEYASYSITTLASVVNASATIRKKGRFLISTLTFANRVPVSAWLHLGLQVRRGGKFVELRRPRRNASSANLAPGQHRITSRIPLRAAERRCKRRRRCALAAHGTVVGLDGTGLVNTEERRGVGR